MTFPCFQYLLFSEALLANEVDPFTFVPSSVDLSAVKGSMFTMLKNFLLTFCEEKDELLDFHGFSEFHEEVQNASDFYPF